MQRTTWVTTAAAENTESGGKKRNCPCLETMMMAALIAGAFLSCWQRGPGTVPESKFNKLWTKQMRQRFDEGKYCIWALSCSICKKPLTQWIVLYCCQWYSVWLLHILLENGSILILQEDSSLWCWRGCIRTSQYYMWSATRFYSFIFHLYKCQRLWNASSCCMLMIMRY